MDTGAFSVATVTCRSPQLGRRKSSDDSAGRLASVFDASARLSPSSRLRAAPGVTSRPSSAGRIGASQDEHSHQTDRRGSSTKILAFTTTPGKPLHITPAQGHRQEALKAEELVEHAGGKPDDSGYSGAAILAAIRARGRKQSWLHTPLVTPRLDLPLHLFRYMVECCFLGLRRLRAVAVKARIVCRSDVR